MSEKSGLVRLCPSDPEQVAALARLHVELLPRSVPARLGDRFMSEFYFTRLPASDLLACELYRHEGRYVGFCTYTKHPQGFLREGFRRHLPELCLLGARILATDPRRLATLYELLRKGSDLHRDPRGRVGYWLTFGVEAAYRRVQVDEHGTRISAVLVRAMLGALEAEGFTGIAGVVERTNKAAMMFYHSLGFTIGEGPGGDLPIYLALAPQAG